MAFNFPEGSKFQFSTTFASAKTITALTNANPAVATSTSHGYTTNDEFLLTSGWEDATNSVYRANTIDANSFGVLGLNSSNTSYFGAGTGVGSAQKISGWVDIPQVLTINSQGGDARFTEVQLLAARNGIKIPTGFNASAIELELAHDPALANYQTMLDISRTFTKCAFRVLGANGASYSYGYMVVSEVPSMQAGQVNKVKATIASIGRVISY
jgi:hypothetical protein